MSEDLGRLPDELRSDVDRRVSAVDAQAQLGRVCRTFDTPPRPGNWRLRLAVGTGAVAAAAAAATWLLVARPTPPVAPCLSSQGPVAVGGYLIAERTESLLFPDGSRMVLAPGTRTRLAAASPREVRVALEEGILDATIKRGTGRWTIEAGPWRITVLGTRFRSVWHPPEVEVEVEEGLVEVRGHGNALLVGPGQHFRSRPGADVGMNAPAPPPPDAAVAPAPPVVRVPAPRAPPPPHAGWRTLADQERYREAIAEIDRQGEQAILADLEAWDGLLLSDAARFAGRPELAWRALNTIRQRSPGSMPAALAAFRLGRTRFHEGAFEEAVGWFDRFLAEAPGNELAADARGKRMEALSLAGRTQEARLAAEEYLRLYPTGPHAGRAQTLITP